MDNELYTGAVPQEWDNRNRIYEDHLFMSGATPEVDWEKGFDIRNVLGGDIPLKDQQQSLSCVGQAWAYQIWVFNVLEMMKTRGVKTVVELKEQYPEDYEEVSARAIYSQIFLAGGGAYIYKGGRLATSWGALKEKIVPSYKEDGSVPEEFMRDKSWQTAQLDELAKVLQGKELRVIRGKSDMDIFAYAIQENFGVVGGLKGQNGRGWGTSERPKPPVSPSEVEWAHCVYYPAFGTDQYGRFIATPNSWGKRAWMNNHQWKPGDPPGAGWQKLYIDYFNDTYQYDPWTYTDLPNINQEDDMSNQFVKFIKDKNSAAVGIWLPFTSPETLKNMALMYNKEVPYKADGGIDWDKLIEGQLELEQPANAEAETEHTPEETSPENV